MSTAWFPNSGSVFDGGSASVPGSRNNPVWISIFSGTASASAYIYNDTASAAGRVIARIRAPANGFASLPAPVVSGCAISWGNLAGGSIVAMVRQ